MVDLMLCKEQKHENWNDSEEWLYNIKFDGERALIYVKDSRIDKIITRRGLSALQKYPEFKDIRFNIKNGLIDSEIIAINGNGIDDFNLLAFRSHLKDKDKIKERAKQIKVKIMAFDILENDKGSLIMKPLIKRVEILNKAVIENDYIACAEYFEDFKTIWNKVVKANREGLIAKHKDSAYEFKRSACWIKIKNWNEAIVEFNNYDLAVSEKFGNIKGITLKNDDGIRCACMGEQHIPIKKLLDDGKKIKVEIQYLNKTNDDKFRFISFKRLI